MQAFEDTYSFAPQSVASHFVLVIVSALHDDVPGTVYPGFQVGWHVDPLAKKLLQSPTPPLVGACDASQGFAEHVASVNSPRKHDDGPDTVYPMLHVGWQVEALVRDVEQSPTPPLIGATDASHGATTNTGVQLLVVLPSPSCP